MRQEESRELERKVEEEVLVEKSKEKSKYILKKMESFSKPSVFANALCLIWKCFVSAVIVTVLKIIPAICPGVQPVSRLPRCLITCRKTRWW